MPIVAKIRISSRDKDGNLETFEPGEVVKGLAKKDEEQLIEAGFAVRGSVDKGE